MKLGDHGIAMGVISIGNVPQVLSLHTRRKYPDSVQLAFNNQFDLAHANGDGCITATLHFDEWSPVCSLQADTLSPIRIFQPEYAFKARNTR